MRKREVALRLLRGEPMDALARELGVEIYRLEEWKKKALSGIDAGLRVREYATVIRWRRNCSRPAARSAN